MLSAVGQDKITQRAIELGAQYYVVKPFDIELLLKRIRDLKNYKPAQNNNFISREVKQQYIEMPESAKKEKTNLICSNDKEFDFRSWWCRYHSGS